MICQQSSVQQYPLYYSENERSTIQQVTNDQLIRCCLHSVYSGQAVELLACAYAYDVRMQGTTDET